MSERSKLAILGGPKIIEDDSIYGDIFKWPIVTQEDKDAVIAVLEAGSMSGTDITKQFEKEFAQWQGTQFALAYPNGTEALRASMWACGVGAGDEIICPSATYWASAAPALGLGAAVNFADVERTSLCIDPDDIEHRICPKTKAIVVVHLAGHPCDMARIMPIADKYNIKVIEDVSHAQGGLYRGRKVGTFGAINAMSLMSGKSLACGEGGMMVTDDRELYERCVAYGHYERTGLKSNYNEADQQITDPELQKFAGLPIGGYKHRMNQTVSAMGRVQLKYYDRRIADIQKANNYFYELLEGVPGVKPHHPGIDSGSTMAGLYAARALYYGEELGGLSCARFCEAVSAEGVRPIYTCGTKALHLHEVFHSADLFNMGKPTMISFGQRDVRQGPGSLPVSENIGELSFSIPWFRYFKADVIEKCAEGVRKVCENCKDLL